MPRISQQRRRQQAERVLQAAARCFGVRGYHRATVEEIAREARLSKGAIYTYFASKEEIFLRLNERRWKELFPRLEGAASGDGDPWERLLAVWDAIFAFHQALETDVTGPRVEFEFWLEAGRQPGLRRILEERRQRLVRLLASLISEGVAAGIFRPRIDPESLARLFWSLNDGLAGHWVARDRGPDREELATLRAAWLDLLAGGLRQAGGRPA